MGARKLWEIGVTLMIIAAVLILAGVIIVVITMVLQKVIDLGLIKILNTLLWPLNLGGWKGWLILIVWWLFLGGLGFIVLSGITGLVSPKKRTIIETKTEVALSDETLKTAIIIPAYNEDETVEVVVKECRNYASEIFVIDDGSTDKTAERAKLAGAKVIAHKKNRGLSETIQDGLRAALNAGADIIVNIDADGQYLPEEIPKLITPIVRDEADFVIGSRFAGTIGTGVKEMSLIKRLGNRIFTRVVRALTDTEISDAQTGFRAFNRAAALASLDLAGRYTYTQEQIIRLVEEGFRVIEVPIYFAKRESGTSRLIASPLDYGARALAVMLRTFRDYHPVLFFGIIGSIFIIAGLTLGAFVIFEWLSTGLVFHESTAVLSAMFVMSGFQFLFFGFLADMFANLKRMAKQDRTRDT